MRFYQPRCLLLPLLLFALSAAPAAAKTVLVLGDSLSAAYRMERDSGWVALLGKRLAGAGEDHAVINASLTGDTSGGGLRRLPALLQRHRPDIVVVELGGNDGLRGFPPRRIRANLGAILSTAQQAGAATLLVGVSLTPNYGRRYTEAFGKIFRDLAQQYQTPLAAFNIKDALAPGMMQEDGIHPTAKAQPLLMEIVWAELKKML